MRGPRPRPLDDTAIVRKLGDSNPRYGYPYVSLANWWFQPLTQTSFLFSRFLADSNRRTRFCRPLTKPLIQGTIHRLAIVFSRLRCKGTAFFRTCKSFHTFFFTIPVFCGFFSTFRVSLGGQIPQGTFRCAAAAGRFVPPYLLERLKHAPAGCQETQGYDEVDDEGLHNGRF